MWVYPEMLTNSLFSLYNGAGDSVFHVSMSPDSTISVYLFLKTLPVSMRSFFIFNERTWMHVAVSIEYSSGNYTGRVFLNGIETARLVTPGAAVLNDNHVARIGSRCSLSSREISLPVSARLDFIVFRQNCCPFHVHRERIHLWRGRHRAPRVINAQSDISAYPVPTRQRSAV
jgi:hypothetical protein